MDDKTWDLLVSDIKEMKDDIKELRREMSTLKIKVASIGAIFGVVSAYAEKFFHKLF